MKREREKLHGRGVLRELEKLILTKMRAHHSCRADG